MGGKGSAPPAPDYRGAAIEQSEASKEIATQQNWANRPNQYTPWGSTTWDAYASTDPATGQAITRWQQNENLDPRLQEALNDQLAIQGGRSDLAGSFMGRVASEYSTPFNWSGMPGAAQGVDATNTANRGAQAYIPTTTATTNEPAFAAQRQALMEANFNRMAPEHARQQEATRTMLANQGLTPGSEAYNRELERLETNQAGERWNALEQSGQEQARMQQMLLGQQQQAYNQNLGQGQFYNQAMQQLYGQDLGRNAQNFQQQLQAQQFDMQRRQQAIAEEAQRRGMSLNEMNALLTGQQVSNPQMPSFQSAAAGQAPNFLGAAQSQYQAGLDAFNAQQQQSQSTMAGIGQIAGTAGMIFM